MNTYLTIAMMLGAWLVGQLQPKRPTGELVVHITDTTGGAIEHAAAQVWETRQGAYTLDSGFARIVDVPAGNHSILVSMIGFKRDTLRDVRVDSGKTTRIEAVLRADWRY